MHATLGPFASPPFKEFVISPLNSVPKKESAEQRLILNLSYPEGDSINEGIHKDQYLDIDEKMWLPSIDQLAQKIRELGPGCKIFKFDLKRGYRQIFLDPKDVNLVGFKFDGEWFFDCTLSMGSRSSARCCQRVTSIVVYIFGKYGHFALNYIDDLGTAEKADEAERAFLLLRKILADMGLQEAAEKTVPPSTIMVFLGIQVNTVEMTLKIPNDKWEEIQTTLSEWNQKVNASLKDVQRLAGLLNFACKCVKSGRIYLSSFTYFEFLARATQIWHKKNSRLCTTGYSMVEGICIRI